ncbi:MAG: potassium transporter Kup [Oligoflexia bacterium]|nr:potassium transporter Kup [Oligoflexia bacterium]
MNKDHSTQSLSPLKLALAAIGVVFGDIGTSPLYAVRECFFGAHSIAVNDANVLGVMSVIFWAIFLSISVKYMHYVMHADNRGEGGTMSLMALASRRGAALPQRVTWGLSLLGILGASLLYADGMLTPAISVLSAVEGLEVATPLLSPWILPITVAILVVLFLFQRHGTARIGAVFGPVVTVWFVVISILGLRSIAQTPAVLSAINPAVGFSFLWNEGWEAFIVLGSVFLALTGGEALYADMGHFGRSPIMRSWFWIVSPALLLNYFGQTALLLRGPVASQNPFFALVPNGGLYPMIALATATTVIASQAVITGAFSVTRQAIQLGYLPRFEIRHTSSHAIGQIYVPRINWLLLIMTVALVLFFQTSSNLASAYGLAVATDMVITTILMFFVTWRLWQWPLFLCLLATSLLLVMDLSFLGANLLKVANGGWFPLIVAASIFNIMATWHRGRELLSARLREKSMSLGDFISSLKDNNPRRVPGTAVFLTGASKGTPLPLLHNFQHNKVIHEKVILVTIVTEPVPSVPLEERVTITDRGENIFRVVASYGFMDSPSIREVLRACAQAGLAIDMDHASFFLGKETILATKRPGMAIWREKLFAFMSRNAQRATAFYHIPPNQVFEIGLQIDI